jgi:hypothetical protein
MKPFAPPKRKLYELIVLVVLAAIFYLIHPQVEAIVLFAFGFIWNWAASNDLSVMFENRRYRMSMIKTVVNLQQLILKPFAWAPQFVKNILVILPAGIFWSLVVYLNDSDMPWWSTFLGSLAFELLQIEINFIKKHKEAP